MAVQYREGGMVLLQQFSWPSILACTPALPFAFTCACLSHPCSHPPTPQDLVTDMSHFFAQVCCGAKGAGRTHVFWLAASMPMQQQCIAAALAAEFAVQHRTLPAHA